MGATGGAPLRSAAGWTLIELVVVLIIAGILAVLAGPRFFATSPFAARGFAGEARAAIAYAHKLAVASGCDVRVHFDAGGYSLGRWADCVPADHAGTTTPVDRPGGGPFSAAPPSGVGVSALEFYFDRIGRPRRADSGAAPITDPAELTLMVGDSIIRIEPETGYVHSS